MGQRQAGRGSVLMGKNFASQMDITWMRTSYQARTFIGVTLPNGCGLSLSVVIHSATPPPKTTEECYELKASTWQQNSLLSTSEKCDKQVRSQLCSELIDIYIFSVIGSNQFNKMIGVFFFSSVCLFSRKSFVL